MLTLYIVALIIDFIVVCIIFKSIIKDTKQLYGRPVKIKEIDFNVLPILLIASFIPIANVILLIIMMGALGALGYSWLEDKIGEIEL